MEPTEKIKLHRGSDYHDRIDTKKGTITVKPMENQIHYETTGIFWGYRDLLKMDEQVWTKSMCNELGRLSLGWKTHVGTDTIKFIFFRDKPKDIIEAYVRAVCDIRPKKYKPTKQESLWE